MKILVAVDGSPHTQKALDYLVAHQQASSKAMNS